MGGGGHVITSGGFAQGMAVTRADVEVVINVVITVFNGFIGARGFRTPNFGRSDNGKGGDGRGWECRNQGGGDSFVNRGWVGGVERESDEAATEEVDAGVINGSDAVRGFVGERVCLAG